MPIELGSLSAFYIFLKMNKYILLTKRYINLMESSNLPKNQYRKSDLKKQAFLIRKKIASTKYLEVYCHLNNIDPNTFKKLNKKRINYIKNLPINYF